MRNVGTVVRGIRTPIIKEGMDLAEVVVDSLMAAQESEGFTVKDKDIIGITEAVVGIATSNYASVDAIGKDVKKKVKSDSVGLVFPILSRNRFSLILKGICRGVKKIYMQLSYPTDEVGNELFPRNLIYKTNLNPGVDVLNEEEYHRIFGNEVHPFTGINYVTFYKELIENEGCEVEFIFSNQVDTILKYTKNVITCDIHTRAHSKEVLKAKGAEVVLGLDDILNESVEGSGFNPMYGLLGSNKSTEERLKLFPKDGEKIILKVQSLMKEKTGKNVEVLVYGDGAFKDPVGGIWELADPVVAPFYTKGLEGTPNELKLKYLSDNKYDNLRGEELKEAIKEEIRNKDANLKGTMTSQGTTPRRYTDLIGSLCDLTSGSGDKGTPVVYIQGYFDNLASE